MRQEKEKFAKTLHGSERIELKTEVNSPSLDYFCTHLTDAPSLLIERLWDAPKGVLLQILQERRKKTILVLSAESRSSQFINDAPFLKLSNVFEFPSWETLPAEEIPPSPDIVGKRLEILHHLLVSKLPSIIICPLQAALQNVPSPACFKPLCKIWKVGDEIPFQTLPAHLSELGYRKSSAAADKGEFAVRGGIIDIFPVSAITPYRVEFFGNTIDTIRAFDPTSQKSVAKVDQFFLSPAQETKLEDTLLSYLGPHPIVIFDDLLALEDRWISLQKLPNFRSKQTTSFPDLLKQITPFQTLFWSPIPVEELSPVAFPKKTGRAFYSGKKPVQPLSFECFGKTFQVERWNMPFTPPTLDRPGLKAYFICEHASQQKQFPNIKNGHFLTGYLSSGFGFIDSNVVLLPLAELTHRKKVRREQWRASYHTPPSDFHELMPGDLVVHFHQGIGKYLGVEKKSNHQGIETEYLLIAYAENSKLYVPLSQAYLVSHYIGAQEEIPTLHTLGSKKWQRAKDSAQRGILGYAQDLLRLSAEREVKGGFVFPPDSPDIAQFEDEFPYPETEDQLRALSDIKHDMGSAKAMDRLVCGDVGYGKTEVALRAAFKAVVDGKKQVAILVPTTVLALQHFETIFQRVQNHPVIVKVISRFHSAATVNKILESTRDGKVDILIGTHRLLSKDVAFKDLGLVIIDEEQRFGVRAKEHLKAFKAGVDCLTLSATPIPRTLYLSLLGAKEISVINTPPQDRLPIKTILVERDAHVIQNALLRSGIAKAQIIADNDQGARLVAAEFARVLPKPAEYAELLGKESDTNAQIRTKGFHAVLDGVAGLKMVAAQSADWSQSEAFEKTEIILQAHPAIAGIIAGNDTMALGAVAAVKSAGLKGIRIVGFDGSPDAIAAIRAGEMEATALQPAVYIAKLAVNEADRFLKMGSTGEPERQIVPCDLVTKQNATDFQNFEKLR